MTRKLFLKHLDEQTTSLHPEFKSIQKSEEGFRFVYSYDRHGRSHEIGITALATCLDEYPRNNNFILYAEDDSTDLVITETLQQLSETFFNKTVVDVLRKIKSALATASSKIYNPTRLKRSTSPEQESDFEDFMEADNSDDDNFGIDASRPTRKKQKRRLSSSDSHKSREDGGKVQMWHDLNAAREAGFRVGLLGNLKGNGIVCLSIRIAKIGMSTEAMRAWSVRPGQYLTMLIKFQDGYHSFDKIIEMSALQGYVEIRVGLCNKYKPSLDDAFDAFLPNQAARTKEQPTKPTQDTSGVQPLFISNSLHGLIRERLASVLKYRSSFQYKWLGAERFVQDLEYNSAADLDPSRYEYDDDDQSSESTLSTYVTGDHLAGHPRNPSFPLVAMQFVLRHVVRCTEFCLVCHRKIQCDFEALKPYVCSLPLCLYQYMQLGFGPSIEWEILSQPYVVDLLICFCYVAARYGRLKEFPQGMDIKVPLLPAYQNLVLMDRQARYWTHTGPLSVSDQPKCSQQCFYAILDPTTSELLSASSADRWHSPPVKEGDWIAVTSGLLKYELHFLVEKFDGKKFQLGPVVYSSIGGTLSVSQPPAMANALNTTSNSESVGSDKLSLPEIVPSKIQVSCYKYDQSFDSLSPKMKHTLVLAMLDTLPPVTEMKEYLEKQSKFREPRLRDWRDRISETSLNLLRWVIASNRSCIMQVDQLLGADTVQNSVNKSLHQEDRVGGMDEWMQFRFAQGAPDKEQRFTEAVEAHGKRVSPKYPTIFGWHGSPIFNWHSIIREGLRFDEILNGRAHGNGVYMSNSATTSLGYTARHGTGIGESWQNSQLKISTALSLNEVVNARQSFVSSVPYYVVAKIDWIQTRYLFVRTAVPHQITNDAFTQFNQDPNASAFDTKNKKLQIPIAASPLAAKKAVKTSAMTCEMDVDDDSSDSCASDCEFLDEGLEVLSATSYSSAEETKAAATTKLKSSPAQLYKAETDFRPATLDLSTIRILAPPNYATHQGTKSLMRYFKEAIKIQEATALHNLGWYINPESVENMYQWLVELHSFDPALPLSKDMKAANITSIVLEMRFAEDFPFSPPFIRVIRPRFLPFSQGGGGHVTEGGAICMELLTNNGWSAGNSIESVLLQVRMAMCDTERPARLLATKTNPSSRSNRSANDSYAIGEAITAYERACRRHGWTVPKSFSALSKT